MAMPKIEPLSRENASEEQRRVGDPMFEIRGTGYDGPFAILLHNSELAERASHYGSFVREGATLPKRLSELVIAMTARHWSAQYEWAAHRHQAASAGVDEAVLEAIRTRKRPEFEHADEEIIYDYVTELYANRGISDGVHGRAVEAFGEVGVIGIVSIAGWYTSVALVCNAFDLEVDEAHPTPPLP
jgi:4-carboxymuconolactone decarboxylase